MAGSPEYFPPEIKAVRIEQDEGAPEVVVRQMRKDLTEKDLVAVTRMDVDVGPFADDRAERFDLFGIEIHEVVFGEWRDDQQGIERTAWDHLSARA